MPKVKSRPGFGGGTAAASSAPLAATPFCALPEVAEPLKAAALCVVCPAAAAAALCSFGAAAVGVDMQAAVRNEGCRMFMQR
jgi:hypothetical protein